MAEPDAAHMLTQDPALITTREIANRLFISPKTADHHIQHVYTKINASTRAAAALWAMERELIT